VTCTTPEPASLYTPTNSGLTETATPASNWMFNQQNNNGEVQAAFGLSEDGNSLAVVADSDGNQQYAVVDASGRIYPTCVMHGAASATCVDDLFCWNGENAGTASEQRNALLAAATRNDFKYAECPTISCTKLSAWYEDLFTARGITTDTLANMCVDDYGSVIYVTMDAYKHICVGFGTSNGVCPANDDQVYFCPGTNDGLMSWGWSGQFANAVQKANDAAMATGEFNADTFTHPQCRI